MHFDRRALIPGVVALAAACSSPKSFVVLELESDGPTVSISGVIDVVVQVSQAPSLKKTLTYPAAGLTIDQIHKNDLSVSFTGGQSGTVTLEVSALDNKGCRVGHGQTTAILRKGSVATATAVLSGDNNCTQADGGTPTGDAFPGCDPVTPACGTGKTCQVNCTTKMGECTAGGQGAPRTTCSTNKDCAPGSQCFDYAGTGCNVKLCLRFCHDEKECTPGSSGDGGAGDGSAAEAGGSIGTRSLCLGPVQCGTTVTAYHTCTFGCDPRESASAAKTSGCPTGLSCLVVGNMDQVDCACPEQTRVGTDGANCTSSAQCAPGYICNMMGGIQKCRAVCRCDASGLTCMAPNDCQTSGKGCTALTNDTIFGVCL